MTEFNGERFRWREILLLALLASSIQLSKSDSVDVAHFLEIEADMISKIRNYSIQEQERLSELKINLENWKQWQDSITSRQAEYITIPQNMFHLFKKLTSDLEKLKSIVIEKRYQNAEALNEMKPPSDDLLRRVALSLVDLQYQYDLKPEDIMNGILMDLRLNVSLSLDSCFFVGKTCSEHNNHQCAVNWLKTCQSLSSDEEFNFRIDNQIYPSYLFSNQKEEAFNHTRNYLTHYFYDAAAVHTYLDLGEQLGELDIDDVNTLKAFRMCRENHTNPTHPKLKCRYNHENSDFLKIAPLKEEEINLYPKVILYRDVVYDSEIEAVKIEAAKQMNVAMVATVDGKGSIPGFLYRISETAFIDNSESFLPHLSKRMKDISALSMNSSEWWQVINYAPGGFYKLHSDFLNPNSSSVKLQGNRMVTMLFYFNDITKGGETVFPRIGLSVKPTKGLVLVWSNVHSNDSKNAMVNHSACPVVIGEKWGFTQWMRAFNQTCLRTFYEYEPVVLS